MIARRAIACTLATAGVSAALLAPLRASPQATKQQPRTIPQAFTTNPSRQSGILYGRYFAFGVVAPPGWLMDDEGGRYLHVDALFYPRGRTFNSAPAAMYANTVYKDRTNGRAFTAVIAGDIEEARKRMPHARVTRVTPLPIRLGGATRAYRFFSLAKPVGFEQVEYIDSPKVLVLLVITANTQAAFKNALPAYRRLVGSYFWVADRVDIRRLTGPTKSRRKP